MAELLYGTNTGCVAQRSAPGGTPGQCQGGEEFAVPHWYRYPRPGWTRLYVCAFHAESEPTAEHLTDGDRAEIARRRARRDEQLAQVTVGPYAHGRRRPAAPGFG